MVLEILPGKHTFLKENISHSNMSSQKPSWLKEQTYSKDFHTVKAIPYHDHHDFRIDEGCYVLVRVYKETDEIGVAICNYNHEILIEFKGKRAQDLYTTIFDYSQKNNKKWFQRLEHAAYLGKELKKAEISLANGKEYVQE